MIRYVYEGLPSGPITQRRIIELPGVEPEHKRPDPVCIQCQSATCEHICPPPRLSPRMVQILLLLTAGARNKEIAAQLKIKEGTVKVYLSRTLFPKLKVDSRVNAAIWALRNIEALRAA